MINTYQFVISCETKLKPAYLFTFYYMHLYALNSVNVGVNEISINISFLGVINQCM